MQTNLHAVSYYFTASWENFSGDEGSGVGGSHGEYVGRSAVEVVNLFGCVWAGFPRFPTAIAVISLRFTAGGKWNGRPGKLLASVATWCEICTKKN